VTEYGAGTARQHRRHGAGVGRWRDVADRVHTAVQTVETSVGQPVSDRAFPQPQRQQLGRVMTPCCAAARAAIRSSTDCAPAIRGVMTYDRVTAVFLLTSGRMGSRRCFSVDRA